jgi:hypothetical protein
LSPPPWEHYRVDAWVRHDDDEGGEVGVFVAHARHASAGGVYHTFWSAQYSDRGRRAGTAQLAVWCVGEEPRQRRADISPAEPKPCPPAAPGGWRALSLEVAGDGLRAGVDGETVGEVAAADLPGLSERALLGVPGVRGDFTPRGSVGLFVFKGAASFKQVVVTRLP